MTPLKRLREQTGLSPYAFSLKAGLGDSHYRQLEAGKSNPTSETLRALVAALASELKRKPAEIAAELLELEPAA